MKFKLREKQACINISHKQKTHWALFSGEKYLDCRVKREQMEKN